jgi:sugar phosphate permease
MPDTPTTASNPSLRRRWFFLLPAVFVTYSLAYLDRANFGFGAAAGMAHTLRITGRDSSLLAAVFFLGYFAFQIPGATLARRFSVRKTVFISLLIWGVCASFTGIISSFRLLVLDRLLLGVAESLVFPILLHLLTQWFTRAERARANALLMLGNPVTVLWMSAVTGLLIQSFGWQRTFILEGLPAIVWAFVWLLLIRDRPTLASWVDPAVAADLESRLTAEQTALPCIGSLRQAFLRPDVLLLCAQYFCWSLGIYGFVLWLPSIVQRGAAASIARTGFLAAIPYLAGIILMLIVAWLSDKTSIPRRHLIWPFLLLGGVAFLGSYFLAARSFPLAFACLVVAGACMYAPYPPFFAFIPDRIPRNMSAEVMALVNSAGALGGFFGSYFVGFLQALTGSSSASFLLMSGALIFSAALTLALAEPIAPVKLPAGTHA